MASFHFAFLFIFAALLIVSLAQSNTTQRGVPLVPVDKGGIFENRLYQSWPLENYNGEIKTLRYASATRMLYLAVSNAIMRVDMTSTLNESLWSTKATRLEVIPRPDYATKFVDLEYNQVDDNVYALGLQPSIQIAKFSGSSLVALDEIGNPRDVAGVEDPYELILDSANQAIYVVTRVTSETSIARTTVPSLNGNITYYFGMRGITTSAAALDGANSVFYLGGADNTVYRVSFDPSSMSTATYTTHRLNRIQGSGKTIDHLVIEPNRPYLYAIVGGTTSVTDYGQIVKIDISGGGFNEVDHMMLDQYDHSITSAVIDPKGILYLGAATEPGRVIQISLNPFNYETSIETIRALAGPVFSLEFNAEYNQLYYGTVNTMVEPILQYGQAAWACEQDCYGHGTCASRTCTCNVSDPQWQLPWCGTLPCPINSVNNLECGGSGFSLACNNGTCLCHANYTGPACSILQCPRNCSGEMNGRCIYKSDGVTPDKCECNPGWNGEDCGTAALLPCHFSTTCGDCVVKPGCGWCGSVISSGVCKVGDVVGPSDGLSCGNWNYGTCPSWGIFIGNLIVGILLAFLFAVNAVSILMEDGSAEDATSARDQWYRMQRSSKAYAAFEQLQMGLAVLVFLAAHLPSSFLEWGRFWLYLLGGVSLWGVGLDAAPNTTVTSGKRSLEQYLVLTNNRGSEMALNAVILWAICLGIVLVLYIIGLVIASIMRGGGARRNFMFTRRPIYILIRVTELFYFGLVVTSASQMVMAKSSAGIAVGVVVFVLFESSPERTFEDYKLTPEKTSEQPLIVVIFKPYRMMLFRLTFFDIGIVFPVVLSIYSARAKLADLLKSDGHKFSLFGFYGQTKPLHRNMLILPWAKRFLIGCAFGFLVTTSLIAQLVVAIVVLLVYIILIWRFKPFADYLTRYLEIVTSSLTILSYLPLFAFVTKLSASGIIGVTVVFLVFQLLAIVLCIGFYVYSWMQMKEIYNLQQLFKCGRN